MICAQERFAESLAAVTSGQERAGGIGTLGERTLHAVLKFYCEPSGVCHEVRVGRYIADVMIQNEIFEIQTRAFNQLRGKLETFLTDYDVTVVYPIAQVKWLCWVSPQTGETSKRRRSPKTGGPAEAFRELYRIRPLLTHPRLKIRLLLMEMEEYRLLDGWGRDGKRGATRCERIPLAINEEIILSHGRDYAALIPPGLPQPFGSRDFAKGSKLSQGAAQTALNVLFSVGAVQRVGKKGNCILYLPSSFPRVPEPV